MEPADGSVMRVGERGIKDASWVSGLGHYDPQRCHSLDKDWLVELVCARVAVLLNLKPCSV